MVYAYNSQIEKIQKRKARAHTMLVAMTVVLVLLLLTILTFCIVLGFHFLSTYGNAEETVTNGAKVIQEQVMRYSNEEVALWTNKM